VEAAKAAIGAAAPIAKVKLETPEDLDKAALAMRREAERLQMQETKRRIEEEANRRAKEIAE